MSLECPSSRVFCSLFCFTYYCFSPKIEEKGIVLPNYSFTHLFPSLLPWSTGCFSLLSKIQQSYLILLHGLYLTSLIVNNISLTLLSLFSELKILKVYCMMLPKRSRTFRIRRSNYWLIKFNQIQIIILLFFVEKYIKALPVKNVENINEV